MTTAEEEVIWTEEYSFGGNTVSYSGGCLILFSKAALVDRDYLFIFMKMWAVVRYEERRSNICWTRMCNVIFGSRPIPE